MLYLQLPATAAELHIRNHSLRAEYEDGLK